MDEKTRILGTHERRIKHPESKNSKLALAKFDLHSNQLSYQLSMKFINCIALIQSVVQIQTKNTKDGGILRLHVFHKKDYCSSL